jgi:signal transduction histidine kinase
VAREDLALDGMQEVEGRQFDDILDGSPALLSFLRRTFEMDPPHHQEETLALAPRANHAAWRVTAEPVPLPGRQKPYWLIAFQQKHHAEASIDATTWAMMARKVTHDIKNPLTNILLTTQRLQSEYRKRFPTEAGALDPYAERIVDRVTHLRRLTKQFMKILDIDALEVVKTDLARLLRDAAEAIERDLPPDVDLVLDLSSDLPGVWVDREQISTALDNLMSNAIHALPEGGTITLSAYPVRELRSSHTHYEPADYAVIEVQDNGVGIAPDNRTRLFEPGFTTSEFGTGLGLALVKHVVEHHGGFIEVESVLDIGSVFSIHLPTIDPTAPERHRHHE